mmetsp:Transcript_37098/g.111128  ORF Transcript_37098/g.111128 Transcript_37098/m.111128 type:complete len:322 (+) Transcript_37098:513-1478(+)
MVPDVVGVLPVLLPLLVAQDLQVLRVLLGEARDKGDPLEDAAHDRVRHALLSAPRGVRRTAVVYAILVGPVRLFALCKLLRPTKAPLIPMLDQAVSLLIGEEVFERQEPGPQLPIPLPRLSTLIGTRNDGYIVLLELLLIDDALEHSVQALGTQRVLCVRIDLAPFVHVEQFAALARGGALEFHRRGTPLALTLGRPGRAHFVPVPAGFADVREGGVGHDLPHVLLALANDGGYLRRILATLFLLDAEVDRARNTCFASFAALPAVEQHISRIFLALILSLPPRTILMTVNAWGRIHGYVSFGCNEHGCTENMAKGSYSRL